MGGQVDRKAFRKIDVMQQLRGSKSDLTMRHVQVFFLMWHNAGSFTEAAKWIGVTQPAISAALKSLEEMCGYELFHRGRGSVGVPTQAAIRLYPWFDRAFRALNDLCIEIETARINPEYGMPFRKFKVALEPIDVANMGTPEEGEKIFEATLGKERGS
jgi:Bacterial regulatory helix-turn-helix protein, lysR family